MTRENGIIDFDYKLWDIGPRYSFIDVIGSGSYAPVCEAIDLVTNQHVAIKCFRNIFDNEKECKRIVKEIELLLAIDCQFIVQVLDVFIKADSNLYMVMEFCQADLVKVKNRVFLAV